MPYPTAAPTSPVSVAESTRRPSNDATPASAITTTIGELDDAGCADDEWARNHADDRNNQSGNDEERRRGSIRRNAGPARAVQEQVSSLWRVARHAGDSAKPKPMSRGLFPAKRGSIRIIDVEPRRVRASNSAEDP
jgi:hypothetical protein